MKQTFIKQILWTWTICASIAILATAWEAKATTITGAGATFPYPVYSRWAYKYEKLTGIKSNYQSIGSGGGIAQIKARTVDFGASDAPMKAEDLKAYGLIQFPMVIGGVVPVLNVSGIKARGIKLTGTLLADIFLGKITRWDDPAIAAINPGVTLADKKITVVHRADGSGTTWIFTNYLDRMSKSWHQEVGFGKSVSWPLGVGGKGNEGVSAYVQRISGSIGYVEFAYALQNKMSYPLLKNKSKKFVAPTMETFKAAAANADWKNAPGLYMVLTDQPGQKSWPITGASFILVYKQHKDALHVKTMLKFFDWCYRHGAEIAEKLHYVTIPENVVDLVENSWKTEIKADSEIVWE